MEKKEKNRKVLLDKYFNEGISYSNTKQYDKAIESFKKATEIDSSIVEFHRNLATIYLHTKQYDKAIESFKKAIKIDPNYKEAHHNLGITYGNTKQYDKAIESFKIAIKIDPNYKVAHNNIGNVYLDTKQYDKAEQSFKKAIKINPNYKEAHNNLGITYGNTKQYDKAGQSYKKAIKIDPNYKDAHNNIGNIYKYTKQYDKAEQSFKKAIKIDPNYKEAHNNLGNLYHHTKQYDKAGQSYKKAIKIDPNYKDAHNNLGNIYQYTKQYDKAIESYKKAIKIDKNYSSPYFNLSMGYLYDKNFKKGFKLYEYRMTSNRYEKYISIPLPVWSGENTEDNVLIRHEQGFGDSFQFFRFIIPLKKKYPNTKFTFLCKEKINHLFKDIIPIITSISDIGDYSYKVSLMSIPHILNIEEINPFVGESYINVESSKILLWKNKLSTLKKLKVAICWKGNQSTAIEKYIPLELFKNISSLDIDLISLQKGDGEEELDEISFKDKIHCFEIDLDKPFIDTVAILKNVDLCITVDTSMVHLAGMLGVKTFLILGGVSEWRWGKSGNKSYWYDSVEIFRSSTINDWTGVLKDVRERIKQIN